MKISVYACSNKGGRDINEDHLDYRVWQDELETAAAFALCDGLGGHQKGEVASRVAVTELINALQTGDGAEPECMKKALIKASNAVAEQPGGLRTTGVALYMREHMAVWGHVGDSRLYHFSNGEIAHVTADHSVTYRKYLAGELTRDGMAHDEDRSSVLRVLGKSDDCQPEVTAEPVTLKAGDAFLLCSDGFWEYVYDTEMLIDFAKAGTPRQWAESLLLRHIARVDGRNDNFSLLTIFVS